MEALTEIVTKNNESGWQKASASIQSAAKIITCKIDFLHEKVSRYLLNMHRNSLLSEEMNNADGEDFDDNDKNDNKGKAKKRKDVSFDYVK